MELNAIADKFSELGHKTRLTIFKQLVKAGSEGLPVGNLQQTLKIPGSTLSHHVSRLINVGLIKQHRDGRTLYCIAQYDALQDVINFLTDECCIDASE
ncbi:ArsR/SmtB family transcription factor [Pseudoalteromonas denitrificans]|uniref:Transcriptional regulator, ArsR family n=1 Tax=Pseudoalteromonas denitrificans DSM 6059 TaxID=1123010 RepID=A0A1I1QG56_9GAMM|nr:metalloregulator ArsR/SmtB family transcription factor [Pseudoalteromonas denitrificans]SFD21134.1 transcriptional regulator, ArsR family [Pseudoalteromonas denitrificans DSM 6059]